MGYFYVGIFMYMHIYAITISENGADHFVSWKGCGKDWEGGREKGGM